jgi:hypothetical protein
LAKALSDGKVVLKNRTSPKGKSRRSTDDIPELFPLESASRRREGTISSPGTESNVLLQAAAAMFGDLVDDLGPPLRALSVRVFRRV